MNRHGDYDFHEGRPNPAFRSEETKEEEIKEAHDATLAYVNDKKDITAQRAVTSLTNLVLLTCQYFILRHPLAMGAGFERVRRHVAAMFQQLFAPDVPEVAVPANLAQDDLIFAYSYTNNCEDLIPKFKRCGHQFRVCECGVDHLVDCPRRKMRKCCKCLRFGRDYYGELKLAYDGGALYNILFPSGVSIFDVFKGTLLVFGAVLLFFVLSAGFSFFQEQTSSLPEDFELVGYTPFVVQTGG